MQEILHKKVVDAALKSELRAGLNNMYEVPALSEQEVHAMTVGIKPSKVVFRTGKDVAVSFYPVAGGDELVVIEADGFALDSASFIAQKADGTNSTIDATKYARRGGWLQMMTKVYALQLVGRGSDYIKDRLVLKEKYRNGHHPTYGGIEVRLSYSKRMAGREPPENEPNPAKAL